jgi:hypothetical protein
MLQRLRQASRDAPVGFWTLAGLAVFGTYGIFFRSAIDGAIDYPTGPWVDLFVVMIKIMLIIGPVLTLLAIAAGWLFVSMLGMALTAINLLAFGGVFFILFFPVGGGFVIGAFVGLGVGFIKAVLDVVKSARELSDG